MDLASPTNGYIGLLTPESIYDDPNGQPLRRELYKRLRYHFQYQNELRLFAEVHHHTVYGDQLLGPRRSSSPRFASLSNLFHPSTVDGCFTHDGHGMCGGIKDENGNLVQHGHEHTHEHTHSDGVTHSHAHTHEGGENHEHTHTESTACAGGDCGSCQGGDCKNETVALLTYMLQHNEHDAAELDQMADNLEKMGMSAAAKTIKESVSDFQKGNMRLGLALTLVKEEMK